MKSILSLAVGSVLFLSACEFPNIKDAQQKASGQFTDQNFKTSISLIELYKIRYGCYPASLDSLTFLGDWDKGIYTFVKYERLDTGYRLDIVPGPLNAKPEGMSYPSEFWRGLGLRQSNVREKKEKDLSGQGMLRKNR